MPKTILTSWGRVHKSEQEVFALAHRSDALPLQSESTSSVLPFGNGRSYGDSCLNAGGAAVKTRALNRFISFDRNTGILICESGVLLSEILQLIVPQGWFLPVTPGTRFVTVGGAIANDVHGKNHHVTGTFGCHIKRFELLRSDQQRLICSSTEHADYFAATIGGLGLTGLVTWAEIQLRPIGNPWITTEIIRFNTLDDFFALSKESDRDYEYTVSWIDCSGKGNRLGRGLFMRGNHAPSGIAATTYAPKTRRFPFVPPVSMVNPLTLKAFNTLYYYKNLKQITNQVQHYEPFFYPLDGLLDWNRLYGPDGFYQYQCIIPGQNGQEAISDLLKEIANSGMGSFLAVLKICGNRQSPGMLSFPLEGVSLALDFPNRGEPLHRLFATLDSIVQRSGGRLYPAKDGRMPGSVFQAGYPRWKEFEKFVDPRFSSTFWRRVTTQNAENK